MKIKRQTYCPPIDAVLDLLCTKIIFTWQTYQHFQGESHKKTRTVQNISYLTTKLSVDIYRHLP